MEEEKDSYVEKSWTFWHLSEDWYCDPKVTGKKTDKEEKRMLQNTPYVLVQEFYIKGSFS